jgi:hypothetical protein
MAPNGGPAGRFFDPCIADVARCAYHIRCNPSSREDWIPMKLSFWARAPAYRVLTVTG